VNVELNQWLPSADGYRVTQYDSKGENLKQWEPSRQWTVAGPPLQSLELAFYAVGLDIPKISR